MKIDDEIKRIIEFYLWEYEQHKNTSKENRRLKNWLETDFGWKATKEKSDDGSTISGSAEEFRDLESALEITGNNHFLICRTNKYKEGMNHIGVADDVQGDSEMLFVSQKYKVDVSYDGTMNLLNNDETRIEALLTAIRNAIAHNNMTPYDNGFLLLENKTGGTSTAKIYVSKKRLLDWIKIITTKQPTTKIAPKKAKKKQKS
ncbi:hypothetical protein FACS1894208_11300 [Clostridia bacterium]|nr:hypothetical protein FACS1894208_11300 [Clostridia bacterium]